MLSITLLIFTLSSTLPFLALISFSAFITQVDSASCFDFLSGFNSYTAWGYPDCHTYGTYNFNSSSNYYNSNFPPTLAAGVKQLSFETTISIFQVCPAFYPYGPFDVFTLTINTMASRPKLLRVQYAGSKTFNFYAENQYQTHTYLGQIVSDATDPIYYQKLEFVGSVDMTNGRASILMGLASKNVAAYAAVSYNSNWNLDSTTQLFVCVDSATGGLLAFCQSQYTYFWYAYSSTDTAFLYYGAFTLSLYTLTEGNTTNFTDSSAYNAPSGPTAWGSSQIAMAPAASTPEGGVFFNSANQFITLRKFSLSPGNTFLKASLTVSFWMRINQTSEGYIFCYIVDPTYSSYYPNDAFSIILNGDRTISAVLGNVSTATVTTTNTITLSTWTMITVTFTLGLSNSYNSIFIYMAGALVKYQTNLPWVPDILATSYIMYNGQGRIGGPYTFIGQIMNVQIFSPGSNIVMDPSCLVPPQTSCQLSLGVYGYGSASCILQGSCDATCGQCSTSPPGICSTCPAQKHLHFGRCVDDCFYYSNGSCLYGSCGGYYYPSNSTFQSDCIRNCAYYWYTANSSCLYTCPSPFIGYQVGDISFCDFPCTPPSYYNSNGTCTSSCLPPYIPIISSNIARYCQFPCLPGSYYFYPNQTCFPNNCTHPHLVARTQSLDLFCDPICLSTESLYPNGSCIIACSAPYTKNTQAYVATCDFPCSDPNKYYFPTNQSCGSTCPSTYYVSYFDGSGHYCDETCHVTQFAYANGSCCSECPSPYISNNDTFVAYCNFPCNTSAYLYPDGICRTACESQYSSYDSLPYAKYCYGPCFNSTLYYYPVEKTCNSSCTSSYEENSDLFFKRCIKKEVPHSPQNSLGTATQVIAGVASALTPGSSINILASISGKIFSNIKFFNISYSTDLDIALLTWKSSLSSLLSVSVSVNMPEKVKESTNERPVPYVFEKHEVSSSFLINFWDNIQFLFLVVLISLGALAMGWMFKMINNRYLPVSVAETLKTVTQNFLIIQMYSLYGDIMLFTVLNLRTLKLEYNLSLLGIGIGLLFVGVMIVSFVKHVKMLSDYQRDKNSKAIGWTEFLKKNAGRQILFKDFKDDSFSKQALLLFLTFRDLASMLILTLLFEHPLVQVLLILVLNLAMIGYLLIKSPFREVFDGFQQLFFEIVTLAVNACLIILAILDRISPEERELNIDIGKFIIYSNIVFNFVTTAFLLFKIGQALRDYYRVYKAYSQKRKLKKKEIVVKTRLSHQQSRFLDHPINQAKENDGFSGVGSPELGPHSGAILQENNRMILAEVIQEPILRSQSVSQIFQDNSDISFVKDKDVSVISDNMDNSQVRLKKIRRKPKAVNILDESIGSPELSKMSSGPIFLDLLSLDPSPPELTLEPPLEPALEPQPVKPLTEGERKVVNRFGIHAKKFKKSLTGEKKEDIKKAKIKSVGLWIQYMKDSFGKNFNSNGS